MKRKCPRCRAKMELITGFHTYWGCAGTAISPTLKIRRCNATAPLSAVDKVTLALTGDSHG